MQRIKRVLTIALLIIYIGAMPKVFSNSQVEETSKIVATDALGRTLPVITGYDDDKYVGMFYWLWHKARGNPRDTTKLLRTNPKEFWDAYDDTGIAPTGGMYYFNEPLYGYYDSEDEYVIKKHIELFIYAGLDFLCLDYTNPGEVFEKALFKFLDILDEYHKAGWKTPKIVFMTNTGSDKVTSWINMAIYKKDRYKDHWFYGPYDKPLLIVGGEDLTNGRIDKDIIEFFHIRPAQWPGFEYPYYEDGFSWCDLNRPPKIHQDMINVSVAQHHSYVFSFSLNKDPIIQNDRINYGRGYTSKSGKNGDVDAILAGANIQEHWDYAISQNPKIVFVTGWNEWATNKQYPGVQGSSIAWFVDSFNTEFSRDIEMTRESTYIIDEETGQYIMEGYGDNYYLQLMQNIRAYKGVFNEEDISIPSLKTIDISKDYTQWDDINTQYLNPSYDNIGRQKPYEQVAADNFLKRIKVTHDDKNIYFLIETESDITEKVAGKDNHMNLFIGVSGLGGESFETYQFLVNRLSLEGNKASFEASKGGFDYELIGEVGCFVKGNIMQIAIPFDYLKIADKSFTIYFKCADSVTEQDDIMDYYVSGISMPLGRLSYVYRSAWERPAKEGPSRLLIITIILAICLGLAMAGIVIYVYIKRKQRV